MTSQQSKIAWNTLNFEGFAKLASDPSLSKYEKIGFPDSYRAGFEERIFADILSKLPLLRERDRQIVDIGPGCSDLPLMLIELCREQGHRLTLIDSAPMLANLPDAGFIAKRAGLFPDCRDKLADLRGAADVILSYSVLHYVVVDSDAVSFIDSALAMLAAGGQMLIGDIPNVSKRRRFFASEAGIAFHKRFTGTDTMPPDEPPTPHQIDDAMLLELVRRARDTGADAYLVPQDPALPMANRREDLLVRKP